MYKRAQSFLILLAFVLNSFSPTSLAQASDFLLPKPGTMVHLSSSYNPPILKGIKVHPENPFKFEFILDQGDNIRHPERSEGSQQEQLKIESTKLIKYFLASLTIPEKDLWVNLSPYEKNRIIPNSFGLTEMGRDLLAEDYMLKQITASLIYPEDVVGKKFWKRIYEEAQKKFGTTNIPINTFNKVWIVPEKAVVYENAKAGTAYVVESKLKVMLEQDYLAMQKGTDTNSAVRPILGQELVSVPNKAVNALGSQIVREIVLPELSKEINQNQNFAQLRQVYNSLILATWYKKKIKDSILAQVYSDKNKIQGLVIPAKAGIQNQNNVESIYQRYLQAFKKGVYNYIKDEQDPLTQQSVPRKYFSGGVNFARGATDLGMASLLQSADENEAKKSVGLIKDHAMIINTEIQTTDQAMVTPPVDAAIAKASLKRFQAMIRSTVKYTTFKNTLPVILLSFPGVSTAVAQVYMLNKNIEATKTSKNVETRRSYFRRWAPQRQKVIRNSTVESLANAFVLDESDIKAILAQLNENLPEDKKIKAKDQAMGSSTGSTAPDRTERMRMAFEVLWKARGGREIAQGATVITEPYRQIYARISDQSAIDHLLSASKVFFYSPSNMVFLQKDHYGLVMLDSQVHPDTFLVSSGYTICLAIAIKARNRTTGKIDIGLAHIYPIRGQKNEMLEMLKQTQGELEKIGYDPLEYIVNYRSGYYHEISTGLEETMDENNVRRQFQNSYSNVKLAFKSRPFGDEDKIAVDQKGVGIFRLGFPNINMLNWQNAAMASFNEDEPMPSLSEAAHNFEIWAESKSGQELDQTIDELIENLVRRFPLAYSGLTTSIARLILIKNNVRPRPVSHESAFVSKSNNPDKKILVSRKPNWAKGYAVTMVGYLIRRGFKPNAIQEYLRTYEDELYSKSKTHENEEFVAIVKEFIGKAPLEGSTEAEVISMALGIVTSEQALKDMDIDFAMNAPHFDDNEMNEFLVKLSKITNFYEVDTILAQIKADQTVSLLEYIINNSDNIMEVSLALSYLYLHEFEQFLVIMSKYHDPVEAKEMIKKEEKAFFDRFQGKNKMGDPDRITKIEILNDTIDDRMEKLPQYKSIQGVGGLDYIHKLRLLIQYAIFNENIELINDIQSTILPQIVDLGHPLMKVLGSNMDNWIAYAVMQPSALYEALVQKLVKMRKPHALALVFAANGPHTRTQFDEYLDPEEALVQSTAIQGFIVDLYNDLVQLKSLKDEKREIDSALIDRIKKNVGALLNGLMFRDNTGYKMTFENISKGAQKVNIDLREVLRLAQEFIPEEMPSYLTFAHQTEGNKEVDQMAYLNSKTGRSVTIEQVFLGTVSIDADNYRELFENLTRTQTYLEKGLLSKSNIQSRYTYIFKLSRSKSQDNAQLAKDGGIDLTPSTLNVQVKSDDNAGIKFNVDSAMLVRLQNASGFVPVIINIQPAQDLGRFLGITSQG